MSFVARQQRDSWKEQHQRGSAITTSLYTYRNIGLLIIRQAFGDIGERWCTAMLLYRFAHIALLAGREVRLLCSALRVVCWHVGVAVSVVVDVIWTVETRQADNDSDDTTNVYHHHHHIICLQASIDGTFHRTRRLHFNLQERHSISTWLRKDRGRVKCFFGSRRPAGRNVKLASHPAFYSKC